MILYKYNIKLDKYMVYKVERENGDAPVFTATFGYIGQEMRSSILKADTGAKVETIIKNKIKKGYRKSMEEAFADAEDMLRNNVMKISTWEKHKPTYPCMASFKLDGLHFHTLEDGYKIYSRNNNLYFVSYTKLPPFIDGELYLHGKHLSEIVEIVHSNPHSLEFHIFDIKDPKKSYTERVKDLRTMFASSEFPDKAQLISISQCNSEEEVDILYDIALMHKYEGLVLRDPQGFYRGGTRSTKDMKRKPVNDEEFNIIAVVSEYDENLQIPLAIFLCITKEGKNFTVKPKCSKEDRHKIYQNKEEYEDKDVTVEFRGYTKYGIPFHPVALPVVRDYE